MGSRFERSIQESGVRMVRMQGQWYDFCFLVRVFACSFVRLSFVDCILVL